MSKVVSGLYYSQEHEWIRVKGQTAWLGITDYAQNALGDIVFADGEPVGTEVAPGDTAGVVESVKAASDIYAPVSGVIEEINAVLTDTPEAIASDPYDTWIVRLSLPDGSELDDLMDAGEYQEYCKTL